MRWQEGREGGQDREQPRSQLHAARLLCRATSLYTTSAGNPLATGDLKMMEIVGMEWSGFFLEGRDPITEAQKEGFFSQKNTFSC